MREDFRTNVRLAEYNVGTYLIQYQCEPDRREETEMKIVRSVDDLLSCEKETLKPYDEQRLLRSGHDSP